MSYPNLTLLLAVLTLGLHRAGFEELSYGPMWMAVLCAVTGLIKYHPDYPVSSRVACFLGAMLAFSPITFPMLKDMRLKQLEKKRAAETAPLYLRLEESIEKLRPKLDEYQTANGYWPDFQDRELLARVDPQGKLHKRVPPDADLVPPGDPFSPTSSAVRWAEIPGKGVLMVSVGQDGVAEVPLPGVSIEGIRAHPLVGIASLGVDYRPAIYDESRGPLGLGDIVYFHGNGTLDELLEPLNAAWDLASKRSPWAPTKLKRATERDPDPQSARDAKAAEKLLQEGEHLAALALASRGRNVRDPYLKQWAPDDFTIDRTRGIALYNLGAFRLASDVFLIYLTDSPNDAIAHFYLAASMFYGGNRDGALTHIAAAAQIDAASPVTTTAFQVWEQMQQNTQPGFPLPKIVEAQRNQQASPGQPAGTP